MITLLSTCQDDMDLQVNTTVGDKDLGSDLVRQEVEAEKAPAPAGCAKRWAELPAAGPANPLFWSPCRVPTA